MMEAARSLGVAARFVSGYIYAPATMRGPGASAVGRHTPGSRSICRAGWIEFDPTNGLIGGKDLIRVAVARAPAQAAPLTGTYYGDLEDELGMDVTVEVTQQSERQAFVVSSRLIAWLGDNG